MSECTGPGTLSFPGTYKTGTAGIPLPGSEIKIDNPDKDGNGEICFRGRHVFMGYMLSDEIKTKETIDSNGYLHSGDIGRFDENGFLQITGRIKELLITAGGENVAPVAIEDTFKHIIPVLSNVMVIGDRKKFLSALFCLRTTANEDTSPTNNLTPDVVAIFEGLGSTSKTVSEANVDPLVKKYLSEGLKKVNEKSISSAQVVQKFAILPLDFSIPGGELGPTLKLKRSVVDTKYAAEIASLYAENESST